MKKLFSLFLCICFFSCQEKIKQQLPEANKNFAVSKPLVLTPGKDTIKLPFITVAKKPNIRKVLKSNSKVGSQVIINSKTQLSNLLNYTTEDGIPLDAINCSMVDRYGNLWLGTNGNGISMFDGNSFVNYNTSNGLADNVVLAIKEDLKGNIWFGTNQGGVSMYDGKVFINYTIKNGLAHNEIRTILEDRLGNMWFGTYGGGVSKFDGNNFVNYSIGHGLSSKFILSSLEDKNGNLWFGTADAGIIKYTARKFQNFSSEMKISKSRITSIIEDRKGNLWFGTYEGAYKYDGVELVNYDVSKGLVNNKVYSLIEDNIGSLWFGCYGGEFSVFRNGVFENFCLSEAQINTEVKSIAEDKNGNIWFSTWGNGIFYYGGTSFVNYKASSGLTNSLVWSIVEDKEGDLWFGTNGNGLSRYNRKSFHNYSKFEGLTNDVVLCSFMDKSGKLWFGTNGGGISIYDGKSFRNYSTEEGLSNNTVWSILDDKDGNIWIGTDGGGVCKFDGVSFVNYTTSQGLSSNSVYSICQDKKGNIWFGTAGGGVSKFDGKSFTSYSVYNGLANNTVWSITEDRFDNLWFGTNGGGVSRYDGTTFKNFSKFDGLPDNIITNIILDNNNENLVFASNCGVGLLTGLRLKGSENSTAILSPQNKLKNQDLNEYDLIFKLYNDVTGYPIKDINVGQNCVIQDNKGFFWLGTGSNITGLVRINFSSIFFNRSTPKPYLKNIKINEKNICYYSIAFATDSIELSEQEVITYGRGLSVIERDSIQKQFMGIKFDDITNFYPIPQNLVLPYEHNNVTFEFNAVQLSRSHLLNFQYMLEGYDITWSPVLKKREATFGNINEGIYTFKLKAQYTGPDGNNEWSEVLTYTFKILPPWYRTWWMYTLYVLTLIGIVYLIIKQQTKKLKQRQKELEQKIDIATEDIREQKQIIEEKHKEITDSINYAERIQRSFLATKELLDENLKNYFLLFKPKDVVSGDFYWGTKIVSSSGVENFVLVTADSTGHGVPGAIMSMLNISCLNEALNSDKLIEPADILNATRKKVISHLANDGSEEGGKDGMDCSLCVFDFKNKTLKVAAAHNPVWIVRFHHCEEDRTKQSQRQNEIISLPLGARNDAPEIIEIKPDKMPVGKHDRQDISFTQHEIQLQTGDVIYTLTDGFPDQFGGEKGKKFMSKNLREFLAANAHLSMSDQKELLEKTFADWKGDLEQVDDVTVMGIKIS